MVSSLSSMLVILCLFLILLSPVVCAAKAKLNKPRKLGTVEEERAFRNVIAHWERSKSKAFKWVTEYMLDLSVKEKHMIEWNKYAKNDENEAVGAILSQSWYVLRIILPAAWTCTCDRWGWRMPNRILANLEQIRGCMPGNFFAIVLIVSYTMASAAQWMNEGRLASLKFLRRTCHSVLTCLIERTSSRWKCLHAKHLQKMKLGFGIVWGENEREISNRLRILERE